MNVIGAHLVGSVPLADAETAMRAVAATLGRALVTMPDGETGARKDWIAWQYGVLAATPGLAPIPVGDRGYLRRQLVRLAGNRTAPTVDPLGYAPAAIASYEIFERLVRDQVIPAHVRFQVSLPTPLAPLTVFVAEPDRAVVEPAYEARLVAELAEIVAAIPHDRLAIQWDIAVEVGLLEGAWPAHFTDLRAGIRDRLARLFAAVPGDVQLGAHLCYGDFGHRHFTNPSDPTTLVELAGMLATLGHPLAWLHVPIPIGWTTPDPFRALAGLAATAPAIYLGVIHLADGIAGARARMALAGEYLPRFGIATECGWGRRPPETIPALLELHAEALAAVR